ncbi:MAG: ATP-binding protein, partial [Chitinophagaceae bacterium]
EGGSWVDAENCGLGLQDLLIMLYFVVEPTNDTVLVEEPESHLHPEMQRKLLNICKERKEKQFVFSTHSSVFLDLTLADTILHTEMTDRLQSFIAL